MIEKIFPAIGMRSKIEMSNVEMESEGHQALPVCCSLRYLTDKR